MTTAAAVIGLLAVGAASFSDSLPGFIARVENRLGLPHIGEPVLHFGGWLFVTVLVVVAVRKPVPRTFAVGGVLLLGLVIEILQPMLSSSRSFEADDIVANVLGVALGFLTGTRAARAWDQAASRDGGNDDDPGGSLFTAFTFIAMNLIPLLVGGIVSVAALGFAVLMGLDPMIMVALIGVTWVATLAIYRALRGAPLDWVEPPDGRRLLGSAIVAVLAVGLLIQVVPYGRDHVNPPITREPDWDSPDTRALAVRACFDCHSNEVDYPWYSNIAPMSWAIQSHVDEGRSKINYSEWDRPQRDAHEAAETVRDGEMPPPYYTRFAHADARLTDAEKRRLIAGLVATFGDDD